MKFLSGIGHHGRPKIVRIFMIARQVHGPNIPCLPAVILARRIASGHQLEAGARPCLDLMELEELMAVMNDLDVTTVAVGPDFEDHWPTARA